MTADTITAIKKALEGVTPGPWKAVSDAHFDSGLVYTSVQPVNVDEEAMKPMAMANGEYHICRMSHTAAPWRFNYHRKNAQYIATVNPTAVSELIATIESLRAALEFYADPEIYKPHPHGPAFDRRDLSYHAKSALSNTGDTHGN